MQQAGENATPRRRLGHLTLLLLVAGGTWLAWHAAGRGDEPWARRAELGAFARVGPGADGSPGSTGRLLEAAVESDDGVVVASVRLDGQARNALAGAGSWEATLRASVPAGGRLLLGLDREDAEPTEAPVACRVHVAGEAAPRLETVLPAHRDAWSDHVVELADLAGSEVELRLGVEAPPATRTFWSELRLAPAHDPRPDVVVVLVDTLRADHLGCYGYGRATSPVIDALAAEGVLFEHTRTVAPWTDPAILALHSGLLPSDVWRPLPHDEAVRQVVPPAVDTLAEVLARAGWFTVAASDHPGIHSGRFGQGFDVFAHLFHVDGPYTGWRQTGAPKIRRQVRELVRTHTRGGLFLYLHLIYPHRPYRPPAEFAVFGPGEYDVRPENAEGLRNLYDGEILRADRLIGDVLGDLEELGLGEDAIVCVLSDHGEAFWEHGHGEHGDTLYDELLSVPLVIRAPGRLAPGRVAAPVGLVDVYPTLLDLAGVPAPAGLRGVSLVPLAHGEAGSPRLFLSEFPHSRIVLGRSIASGSDKLIDEGLGGAPLYFDLAADPGEHHDLSAEEGATGERVRALRQVLEALPRSPRYEGETAEPSAEMRDALRALGYGG